MLENPLTNLRSWVQCVLGSGSLPENLSIRPNVQFSFFYEVLKELERLHLLNSPTTALLVDLDGTIRLQPKSNLWRGRFGEISELELTQIQQLNELLCRLIIVTDQIGLTSLIPAIFSILNQYPTYPAAINELGILHIHAQEPAIPGLCRPYKESPQAIEDTLTLLSTHPPKDGRPYYERVVFIDNNPSAMWYAHALCEALRSQYSPDTTLLAYLLTDHPPIPIADLAPLTQAY